MQTFAAAYSDIEFTQQLAAQVPWFHYCIILDKIKDHTLHILSVTRFVIKGLFWIIYYFYMSFKKICSIIWRNSLITTTCFGSSPTTISFNHTSHSFSTLSISFS